MAHYTCLGQALKELEAALEVRTDVNKLVVVIECGHAARHRRERSRLSMQKLLDDCPEKCRWAFETVFEQSSRFDDLSMETSRNNPLKGDGFSTWHEAQVTGRRVRFRPRCTRLRPQSCCFYWLSL